MSNKSKTMSSFIMDPNLVVSDTMSENDPRHPKNIMKKSIEIHNQAVADTKYDEPYTRVEEGFTSMPSRGVMFLVFIGILMFFIYARTFRTLRMSYLLVLVLPLIVMGYIRNWELSLA